MFYMHVNVVCTFLDFGKMKRNNNILLNIKKNIIDAVS